jgi:small subunit ribosomal protein S1
MSEGIQITSLGDVKPKMKLEGTVKQIQLAGAIVDVGLEECDALLHISQIRRKRVNNVRDVLEEGQQVSVWVRSVDNENGRLDVTMIRPPDVSWDELKEGQTHKGSVVRIEKFGAFVDIGAERPGLVHISELANGYIEKPEDVVQKGQEVEVRVIGVNRQKRQIDLSMKTTTDVMTSIEADEPEEELPTAMALALQRAMENSDVEDDEISAAITGKNANRRDEQDDILKRALERHGGSKN